MKTLKEAAISNIIATSSFQVGLEESLMDVALVIDKDFKNGKEHVLF